MKIKPLADRVLVQAAPAEEKVGGIIIPDTAKEKPQRGKVIAVGQGTKDEAMVLKEGDVCRNFYYIDRGLMRQFYFKHGKEVTEHLAQDHTIVMCIESLFKEEPTHLQIETLEPTVVYAIPKVDLERVALHNVNIQILYRKILEESLITSQVHADLVRFETAQDRYKKLCKLMPQVVLRAPLVYIASYLQMTPETLSRVRASTLLD